MFAFFVSLALLSGCPSGAGVGVNPGDAAPAIEFPLVDGSGVGRLSDHLGKVVLINFWATWCAPCVEELPALQRLYEKLGPKGLVVLAVGVDDHAEQLLSFKQRYGLSFPILVDEEGGIKSSYRVSGVPESFVVGRDGKLLMIADPDDGQPVVRILGPRAWDSPNSIARLEKVLIK
jgi:cytochrome c biogenesis protein CcmG/thiol:disulfide interchange protein DsbE